MLLQFVTKNYASIRDEVILSLEPSSDSEHPENILTSGKYKAVGAAAIYGANASGKTALYKAMYMALSIIRSSNILQINDAIPVVPFKFDEKSAAKPSKFEFTFVAADNKKYIYGFSADARKVHEEYLYRFNTARPGLIFERKESEYKFARAEKKVLASVVCKNTDNKLFLATATSWNVESTALPYRWLADGIDAFTNDDNNIINLALNMYRTNQDENVNFAVQLLKKANINIRDIQVESKKIDTPKTFGILIAGHLVQPQEQYEFNITTKHTVTKDDEKEHNYALSLTEESLGTQMLFFLAPLLYRTFRDGKVLIVDEINRSLHPFIVKFLVNLFRDHSVNKNGAQLIFTTHETTLLSLDIFRRDQIYFTEKDAKTEATDLFSLDEFPVRKTDNIKKDYLLGRYGAIPFLQTEEII